MSEHRTEEAATPGRGDAAGERSRRSFLIGTAAAAAASGAVLAPAAEAKARRPIPFIRRLPDLYPNWNRRNLLEILEDEQEHITVLTDLLDNKPTARPTFRNLEASTPFDFIRMAAMIENGGVGSYLQGVNAISQESH